MEEPCCICLEEITGGNAVLKCGHKVGLDCFVVMVSNDYEDDKIIKCPICREVQDEIFESMAVNINKVDREHIESRLNRLEDEIMSRFIPTIKSMCNGYEEYLDSDNEGGFDGLNNLSSSLNIVTELWVDKIKDRLRRVREAINEDSRD